MSQCSAGFRQILPWCLIAGCMLGASILVQSDASAVDDAPPSQTTAASGQAAATSGATTEPAGPDDDAKMRFFENHIRPLLAEHCWSCHGAEKQKGGLRLDTRAGVEGGGDSGAVLVAGDVDASLLIEAVRYEGYEMPPAGPLPDEQIRLLEQWVSLGAPWPDVDPRQPPRDPTEKITAEDRAWWAFQPVREPAIPEVPQAGWESLPADWESSPIDRFLFRRMHEHGLSPAPPAEPRVLARRVYLDMLGVPPSPAELDAFLSDTEPGAYERLISRVLDDQRYGERWAQHWLDLVRYADSDGYRADFYRPRAWRYRDYVIRAFNDDKPYDRFVQEQLAGDELFPQSVEAKVATSFLRNWIYEYNLRDARGQWETILTDVTNTAGDVFLGMGMQCAQCHDHKFDPILQRDYFRLRAFFEPLLPVTEVVATAAERDAHAEQLAKWEAATVELRRELDALERPYLERAEKEATERFPLDIQAMMRKPPEERTPREHQLAELAYRQVVWEWTRLDGMIKGEDKKRRAELQKQLAAFDELKPQPLPEALVAVDAGPVAPHTTMPGRPDEIIEPGFLTILEPDPAEIPDLGDLPSTGRRAALALWLTRPDNPLSTRVIVNRVWQYHFGRGLAPNGSDFGKLGGPPTHPELLDWLTVQFVRDGWSLKQLHRRILRSAAYRQSSRHPRADELTEVDPHNDWYWRGDTRRLDAEQIRDTLLAVTGSMNWRCGGEGYAGDQPRRSIYRRFMRNSRDPFLDLFDLPLFFNSESARNTTTTPLQALMLINSKKMVGHARQMADRLARETDDPDDRLEALWRLAYGREPSANEREAAFGFLEQATRLAEEEAERARKAAAVAQLASLDERLGAAVDIAPQREKSGFQVPVAESRPARDFTFEAFFQVRSIYESGSVRTIASQRDGNGAGWAFGVTGKGSRRKPRTMVIQLWGRKRDGSFGEAALFSGADVTLGHTYHAAVAVRLADAKRGGTVTFYLRDLTNKDAPTQVVVLPHEVTESVTVAPRLVIGGTGTGASSQFDGLLDEVRWHAGVLAADQLAAAGEITREDAGLVAEQGELIAKGELDAEDGLSAAADATSIATSVRGYWPFASAENWQRDASSYGQHILPPGGEASGISVMKKAWSDLCHAVLNSNEFLYVE